MMLAVGIGGAAATGVPDRVELVLVGSPTSERYV